MDFFSWVRELSDIEIASGDYVTLSRHVKGFMTYETLQTFSDIIIKRKRPTYAYDAKTLWESDPDISQIDEETD
jgi:hypothetical protein